MTDEHQRLLQLMPRRPEDYRPWGDVERWADPRQRYPDCSSGCRFARWLEDVKEADGKTPAPISMDWCVCTNPASHRVGLLTFEHQGCQKYEPEDDREDDDYGATAEASRSPARENVEHREELTGTPAAEAGSAMRQDGQKPGSAGTSAPSSLAVDVAELIERRRLDTSTEPRLRDAIAVVLNDAGLIFDREVWLSDEDRIDFLVHRAGRTVGIEVKIAGSRSAVVRQLMRYAGSSSIDALVLATSRSQLTNLPDTMRDKLVVAAMCWALP